MPASASFPVSAPSGAPSALLQLRDETFDPANAAAYNLYLLAGPARLYVAVADARGTPRDQLGGTVQNDVLKEYIARGTYIYPPKPSLRLITDVFDFTAREVPQWNSISVSGYHMREAGSTAVQELAFTLANGLAYLEAAASSLQLAVTFVPDDSTLA